MSKAKKFFLILIPFITCIITAVVSILIYSNFSNPEYEKMIKAIVGNDNYKQVDNCEFNFKRYYLYTDGSKILADEGSGNYEFEKWD